MSKQTAVEWLTPKILGLTIELSKQKISQRTCELEIMKFIDQAKAMERDQMLELISFVRVHNKMGKTAEDLLQQFEAYKGGSNE